MTAVASSDILEGVVLLEPAAHVPSAPMPEVLRLSAVVKEYPMRRGAPRRVLDGIDLAVTQGEFVAVLGPSGCGKSTILRLAAGLEAPTSGTARRGFDDAVVAARHRGVGLMSAKHALLPWATIASNVAAAFERVGRRVDNDRVTHLLDVVGLADVADARPHQLTAEGRQRASLARALVLGPKTLFLDDPFGAFDPATRRRLDDDVRNACAHDGVAVLFVGAAVDEAVAVADRVVVLGGAPGRIKEIRSIEFAHPRRSDLLGSAAFERIVAELTRSVHDEADTIDLRR